MKIVIACDSFKESMSAKEACYAIEKGIKAVDQHIDCLCIPMADGGEGTTEVLMDATHSLPCFVDIHNPFQEVIHTSYGMNKEKIAVMEVAATCGLDLIPREKRNPTYATSVGLGEMILDALNKGAKEIIIGLGGSGTNDGGYGMLYALGAKFYDDTHQLLPLDMTSLLKMRTIDLTAVFTKLKGCQLIVASDVDNVFTGVNGATYIFGKQKGANPQQLEYLEKSLLHFQSIINNQYHIDLSQIKKTGAAGGIGGALYLLGAKMMSGIDLVLQVTQFQKHIQNATYIMTGEGSVDYQTIHGKTISGIAKMASLSNVPVIVLAGRVSEDASNLYDIGVTAMFSITNEVKTLTQALASGAKHLTLTTINIIRLLIHK